MNVTIVPSPNFSKGRWFGRPRFIVLHSIVGTMAHADRQFTQRGTGVSAHYAVDGLEVHQYVDDNNTAWHSGNFAMNNRSIGIEVAGGGSFGEAIDESYRTLALLIVQKAQEDGITISRDTVIPHRNVVATACPSGLNLDRVFAEIDKVLNPPPLEPSVPAQDQPQRAIANFPITVTCTVQGLRVRTSASTQSGITRSLAQGTTISVVDRVEGESINGVSVWLKTQLGNFVWSGGTTFEQYLDQNNLQ
jgi:hypothetical protein